MSQNILPRINWRIFLGSVASACADAPYRNLPLNRSHQQEPHLSSHLLDLLLCFADSYESFHLEFSHPAKERQGEFLSLRDTSLLVLSSWAEYSRPQNSADVKTCIFHKAICSLILHFKDGHVVQLNRSFCESPVMPVPSFTNLIS